MRNSYIDTNSRSYPRTLQQAFGPYARLESKDVGRTKSVVFYVVAFLLSVAAVVIIATA